MLTPMPLVELAPAGLSPVEAFARLRQERYPFWLDSGMDPQRLGRYSFLGCDPFALLSAKGKAMALVQGEKAHELWRDPLDTLADLLHEYHQRSTVPSLAPFVGGAVGYFSYDLAPFIERVPLPPQDDLQLPDMFLAFYDVVLTFDHLSGQTYIVSSGMPEKRRDARVAKAKRRLQDMRSLLEQASEPRALSAEPAGRLLRSNFQRQAYLEAVERAREYTAAGDIYQVNLSQRFETELKAPPADLYLRLRELNPAPFAAYLQYPGFSIVSSSPERFVRVVDDVVETRPIKGTRPRSRDEQEDAALRRELDASAKDRAEHIMIVDLERNDLGRVCVPGTVRVSEMMALEDYATVHHLTSTVEGQVRPDVTPVNILRATFPGGSITGAPKVRAMEIIAELEPTRRSVYTGAIGYIGFNGDMDLNIAIRTIITTRGRAYFQVGGAIVHDSKPEQEYQETLDKGQALARTLGARWPEEAG